MANINGSKSMESDTVESRFEDILSLVIARSRGEVGNDAVESALASIIPSPGIEIHQDSNEHLAETASGAFSHGRDAIIEDKDDYDDDEVEGKGPSTSIVTDKEVCAEDQLQNKPRGRPKTSERIYDDSLESIPLGKMGSRMLITFGDGPQPRPEVISAALLGARSSLQRAILDARALHRRLKDQWYHARAAAVVHTKSGSKDYLEKTKGAILSHVMDNELSFRALDGFDSMKNNAPCGFDLKSLEMLFPEEMGAYQRWKKMHEAYTRKGDDGDAEDLDSNETSDSYTINQNGRLFERLGNFDTRTSNMGPDSYLKFSDVRRGSFLPRKNLNAETKEWQKSNRKRGRAPKGGWSNLHPSCVVFLYWLGFDPMSSLPPPDEETTQALGFLAHDFLGKIVETAVVRRLMESKGKCHIRKGVVPELSEGDQLELRNIEEAISATHLKSLYSSSGVDISMSSQVAQLYFGPGFEDRLELELEEIFAAKHKRLTPEEMKMRQEEEALFSNIAGPPSLPTNFADVLGIEENKNDDATGSSTVAEKKPRTEDHIVQSNIDLP
eukprot:CCRYP_020759-RA/>CCRYP_020759-RA protein AED:0.05 eAED:0.05 QI:50/1/1/1/0.75/0.6/5/224/554